MAYSALAVPVMIASPGDVDEERKVAREIMHAWNDVHSESTGVILVPVGWETHSFPELGDRPQALINRHVLKNCDLLVGIFWTRIGTPTGKAASGTIEEIQEHLALSKPVMLYFSAKPVVPDSVDPEQYSQVKAFREKFESMGLIQKFDTVEDFKEKFGRQLTQLLTKNQYFVGLREDARALNTEQHESETRGLDLSEGANRLLKAAAASKGGTIIFKDYIGGVALKSGEINLHITDPREIAKWQAVLDDLIHNDLVEADGPEGLFKITHEGYLLSDQSDS